MNRRPPPLNPGAKAWTPAEDEILRQRYEAEGAAAMARLLGRPIGSINHRTQRLGIYTHRRWTAEEDKRLRLMWGEYDLTETAKRIGRTVLTTFWRAQFLGLPLGCPQGFEYITTAAGRSGYSVGQLRKILRWAGTPIRFSMARPSASKRRSCIVDPDLVDAAVTAWLKDESLNAAAKRYVMTPETLERCIRSSGLKFPPKPRRKKCWRIPTEVIDAAVAKRRSVVPLRQIAIEVGMLPGTLRRRAIRAGIARPPGKLWLVNRADVAPLLTLTGKASTVSTRRGLGKEPGTYGVRPAAGRSSVHGPQRRGKSPRSTPATMPSCSIPGCTGYARAGFCADHWPRIVS